MGLKVQIYTCINRVKCTRILEGFFSPQSTFVNVDPLAIFERSSRGEFTQVF